MTVDEASTLIEEAERARPGTAKLARLVCLAVRVEATLLRRMRLRLAPEVDVGVEADLWFSPLVESQGPTGFVLQKDVATLLRQSLASEHDLLEQVDYCTSEGREGAQPSILLEERVTALALRGGLSAEIELALRPAVLALLDETRGPDVARWAMRALPRFPHEVLKTEAAMMLSLGASARMGDRRILDEGEVETALSPNLAWILPKERLVDRVRFGIRLSPEGLQFVPAKAPEVTNEIELPRTEPLWIELSWKEVDQRFARMVHVKAGRTVALPENPSEVTLRTLAGDEYLVQMVGRNKPERMLGKILLPEIRSLIEERNFGALREIFREWPPADVAELIVDLPEDEQGVIFRLLPNALAADVFEYLEVEAQQKLLRAMSHEQVVAILNEMSPADRMALLEELPSTVARQLIRLLSPDERRAALALLGYPEGSVGRLMTPDFIAIHDEWTVKEVLDHIREFGRDSETLNVIYVVDERGKLIDDLRMREFLLRPLTAKVSDFRDRTFLALKVNDSQEEALNAFRKYDRVALPVIDSDGILIGVVTIDDLLDVAEEEATEDLGEYRGTKSTFNPMGLIKNLWKRISERSSKSDAEE